ncbi:Putative F-box/LRR-repeat protein At3g28410 [Linum grandiflorum]
MEEKQEEDRISSLPDVIIHDILYRLRSPKESAKTVVLSKRWMHLWLSYPYLEFEEGEGSYLSHKSLNKFVAASSKKFSQIQTSCPAVRISIRCGCETWMSFLLDSILNFAAGLSPHEIDIRCDDRGYIDLCDGCPIPPWLLLDNRFNHLEVLKLDHFDFSRFSNDNSFSCLGSSLKVLCLHNVSFPPEGRILTNLISGASRLETLNANSIRGMEKFEIRQHPTLKMIEVGSLAADSVSIGTTSLEILELRNCSGLYSWHKMRLSLQFGNSLRILRLTKINLDDRILDLNGLIATASLLETLSLTKIEGIHSLQVQDHPNLKVLEADEVSMDEIVIVGVPSLEILRIILWQHGAQLHFSSTPNLKVLHIDALQLTSKRLSELISGAPSLESLIVNCCINEEGYELRILNCDKLRELNVDATRTSPANRRVMIEILAPNLTNFSYRGFGNDFPLIDFQPVAVDVKFHFIISNDNIKFHQLKHFLGKLSKLLQVTVEFEAVPGKVLNSSWSSSSSSPTPVIHHVHLQRLPTEDFLENLFWSCRPQSICSSVSNRHLFDMLTGLGCGMACKCWRHKFKDMKIVYRAEDGKIREYKVTGLSMTKIVLYMVGLWRKINRFTLIWV